MRQHRYCVAHPLTRRYVFSSLLQVTSFNEILLDLGDYSTRCVFQKDYYMRMLKIETFAHDKGNLIDSISIPSTFVKALMKLLPKNVASKFDENGEQFEAIVSALTDPPI
ncbi:hypothetical protein, partial [Vibrio parahaemolyticus]|uniref:hypothetical protein n=4 Tax=Vibrio parahaemolyticus TaxID=670 RepID=UPI0021517530